MRIGVGYDVHRFKKERELVLGGEKIDFNRGLEGHSDADVLIHALIDALLGASGQGDIGVHFPDKDEKWKAISSLILLAKVFQLLKDKKLKVGNIDLTVVLEEPKLISYYPKMKRNIAKVLECSQNDINIKASTNEKMGFVGKKEGVMVLCVVLLKENR